MKSKSLFVSLLFSVNLLSAQTYLVSVSEKNEPNLLSVLFCDNGTFDEKEKAILDEFNVWMDINKKVAYDARPWKIFGDGLIVDFEKNLSVMIIDWLSDGKGVGIELPSSS